MFLVHMYHHATGMTARLERAHAMAFQMLQGQTSKTADKYTLLINVFEDS